MPELFVLAGRDVGRSFVLEGPSVLGRSPDCEIVLHDRSVSRAHARIEPDGDAWFVVDSGSRNGVRVNGERIERHELSDHDEIVLGELPLRFRVAADVSTPSSPPPPPPPPPPAPAEPAAPAPGRALSDPVGPGAAASGILPEDEIVLEEEIDLAATAARPQPDVAQRLEIADLSPAELQRARLVREANSGGLLSSDLGQRPLWVQFCVYALVIGAFVGICWGVFRAVGYLRGTV